MGLLARVRARLPAPVKRAAHRLLSATPASRALSPFLPPVVCVDVGASYFPHGKWRLFLMSPATSWIAVEPNAQNLAYLDTWPWAARPIACKTGLSQQGGRQTLYVTNVDSGSSLLEPVVQPGMKHRIVNLGYFFPVRKVTIETLRLADVIPGEAPDAPVVVKLDTQGSELSILAGSDELVRSRVVGIEMEATLLAQPIMQGSGKFWQACRHLEERGFELLLLDPIMAPAPDGARKAGRQYLNECDAVYALRADVAAQRPVAQRVALLAFYLSYGLFGEARALMARDPEAARLLERQGCDMARLEAALHARA